MRSVWIRAERRRCEIERSRVEALQCQLPRAAIATSWWWRILLAHKLGLCAQIELARLFARCQLFAEGMEYLSSIYKLFQDISQVKTAWIAVSLPCLLASGRYQCRV